MFVDARLLLMIYLSFAFREKTEMIRSYIQEVVQYIKRVCWLLKNKNSTEFKGLNGFIQRLMNWAATHVVNRKLL